MISSNQLLLKAPLLGVVFRVLEEGDFPMMDRRSFLGSSFRSSLALGVGLGFRGSLWAQLQALPSKLPEPSLYESNEDAYWSEMRKQFLIPADEVYLNNGTVGSSPAPVLRAIFEGYETCEKLNEADPEDYPIWGSRHGTSSGTRWQRSWAATGTRLHCSGMPPRRTVTSEMAWT
jgi:hypothetical protein